MSRLKSRHRVEHIKTGHERWLVSYADFITLLFAFFVVMYSVSQVNETKYQSLSETLNTAFNQATASNSGSDQESTVQGSSEETTERSLAKLESLSEDIQASLSKFDVAGEANLSANENWVELTLSSELLFKVGRAQTNKDAQVLFSDIADMLSNVDNEIQVVGHTDDLPISNAEFSNNWELSSARAISIVNLFAFQGIQQDRMSAVAFGEFRPVADNSTEEGRRKNRRVVLRISSAAAPAEKEPIAELVPRLSADELEGTDDSEFANPSVNPSISPTAEFSNALQRERNTVKPVRLKGGDLLFTSDPDLPRRREIDDDSN